VLAAGVLEFDWSFTKCSDLEESELGAPSGELSLLPPLVSTDVWRYVELDALLAERYPVPLCTSVLYEGTCFDTGSPQLVAIDVDGEVEPSMWVVEVAWENGATSTRTLPGACSPGMLTYFLGEGDEVSVFAVGNDGQVAAVRVTESQEPTGEESPSTERPNVPAEQGEGDPGETFEEPAPGETDDQTGSDGASSPNLRAADNTEDDGGCNVARGRQSGVGWAWLLVGVAWLRRRAPSPRRRVLGT
jgi:hypothetical protein